MNTFNLYTSDSLSPVRQGTAWHMAMFGVIALAAMSSACTNGPLGLISTQEEVQFGAQAHQELLKEYAECTQCQSLYVAGSNLTVTQYVTGLGQQLANIGNPDRGDTTDRIPRWTFTVVQSDEINAFAIPGGYLYATTGLLGVVENKAELAGILGHEVGHVTAYHGIQRLENFMIVNNLSTLIFGSDSSLVDIANIFVSGYDNFVSSKDDEREADRLGVKYSYKDGYNPLNMNKFFEYIKPLVNTDAISQILSTHPAPSERIVNVRSEAAAYGVNDLNSPNLLADDSAVPYSSVRDSVQSLSAVADLRGQWGNLPAWVRTFGHACRFDPRTRQIIDIEP